MGDGRVNARMLRPRPGCVVSRKPHDEWTFPFPEDTRMPRSPNAATGQFLIGGDIPVNRLGFGAMRITGKGIWGEPAHPEGAAPPCAGCRSWAST